MQDFSFKPINLKGAFLIQPFFASDNRGGLVKDYNADVFMRNDIKHEIKEVFYTLSKRGVIRAIHFQNTKQQAKLVRCIKGRIFDVIVDLRKDSATYGKWEGYYLTEENMNCLYVPRFFGHGYLVIEDSIVSYQCDEVFYSEYDSGIIFNDPEIGISWPYEEIGGIENLILSEKDRNLIDFQTYSSIFN